MEGVLDASPPLRACVEYLAACRSYREKTPYIAELTAIVEHCGQEDVGAANRRAPSSPRGY